MIKTVFETSAKIKDDRGCYDVLASLMSEVGELSTEIAIYEGHINRPVGKDGIIGEAIDVIACALDIIYLMDNNITKKEINEILRQKCEKWYNTKTSNHNA